MKAIRIAQPAPAGSGRPAAKPGASSIHSATAPGSTTADFPMITKGLLGAKFRLVTGYQGSREVTLAVEKNEVQGACGFAWPSINVTNANWFGEQGFVRVLAQTHVKGHPELNAMGVTIVLTTHYLEEAEELCQRRSE